ncbi:unnamed protein product [Cylicocyclus nassatus]|uniref:sarcosine oxidasee (formaldehyde-forming) n=1 Tax=Cylicocyclus nassatus TaxID=53992 RepID=A0AA36HFD8_CYLNA|nr:unnamed protein product [Cylicocyclus nassatus]
MCGVYCHIVSTFNRVIFRENFLRRRNCLRRRAGGSRWAARIFVVMDGYDVIVVGAGIFGSCTAYHCQKRGLRTILIEQFNLGHKNGSSHGMSRIIRYAHTEPEYVPLVRDAYQQIAALERKIGESLWKRTGLLWVSKPEEITSISKILHDFNIEHETISGEEVGFRYPQFSFGNNWAALIDPEGGVLYADKWLRTFQDEFISLGGTILENEEVLSYSETDDIVKVTTSKCVFHSKKVIFTVGPWLRRLFPDLPLQIQPESIAVCYWKAARSEDAALLEGGKFPVFIAHSDGGLPFGFYGLPAVDYAGCAKICFHSGEHIDGPTHPENVCQEFIDHPAEFIREHMPILDSSAPAQIDRCKYTVSEDNHYVIGHYQEAKNVLIGGGCSGSGFKVAPGIGRALSQMAANEKPSIDISFFSFDRFQKSKQQLV